VKKINRNKLNFVPVDESHKIPTKKDMVYFQESPDFCTTSTNSKYKFEGNLDLQLN